MIPVILLAEDDSEMRKLLVERLQRRGWFVVEISDSYELMAYVALASPGGDLPVPDAVVTDLHLPGADGLTALQAFRHCERVVLISAFVDAATIERAHAVGVQVVLAKPFKVEALIAEVERVLGA